MPHLHAPHLGHCPGSPWSPITISDTVPTYNRYNTIQQILLFQFIYIYLQYNTTDTTFSIYLYLSIYYLYMHSIPVYALLYRYTAYCVICIYKAKISNFFTPKISTFILTIFLITGNATSFGSFNISIKIIVYEGIGVIICPKRNYKIYIFSFK